MRVTAVINQKGGVGKTTTVDAIWSGLNRLGRRALAIDLDPQGNLTWSAGADNDTGPSMLGVLLGETKVSEAVRKTARGDIIPAGRMLATFEAAVQRVGATGTEYRLRDAIRRLASRYEHVIIDTPPALGSLTVNALTAADGVIIPCQADPYSIQGVSRLADTIALARQYSNASLSVDGLLLTRFSARAVVRRELAGLARTVAGKLGTVLFVSTIREAVAVTEAQLEGASLFDHAPRAKVTTDYQAFLEEWLAAIGAPGTTRSGD